MKAINYLNYRLLGFNGTASGWLGNGYDINAILNKTIVIKSLKFFLYDVGGDNEEFHITDAGLAPIEESVVETRERIHFVRDLYLIKQEIKIRVNGNELPIFSASEGVVPDLQLDNLFLRFPEKITNSGIEIYANFQTNGAGGVYVKALMEVYLEDPLTKKEDRYYGDLEL